MTKVFRNKNLKFFFVAALLGLSLAGCNTFEGVGKDVEAAGDSIEDAAEDAKD